MNYKITVDRFEENKAILKTDDGPEIIWPKDKLPPEIREGDVLDFSILKDEEAKTAKKKQAKDILNEILDVDEK
ncbi:hypothetical protein COV49_00335 [Candidatus Falkowbacteria bacterium CG11_big_fil_rev_8_21_14_0_20_39_10]|uniref:DUF3006 domain-containing protein n=1 Tax=Candidatus Falkowbacteria bacterium CG11_big_fil_rev_8_21_14_0_20_39_10 TaxID=1974570 RepID=A0A2M6KA26_9BACT|nr:MAG: hypothetical protein COV49_00335 [Candidatus Falkowbacteria bacterium CG11_big_fil_rev_8_21_14_0_20_39_10]